MLPLQRIMKIWRPNSLKDDNIYSAEWRKTTLNQYNARPSGY
jgi:hypothetical protein